MTIARPREKDVWLIYASNFDFSYTNNIISVCLQSDYSGFFDLKLGWGDTCNFDF